MLLEQVKLRRYFIAWLEATRYERDIRELASKFRRFNDQVSILFERVALIFLT